MFIFVSATPVCLVIDETHYGTEYQGACRWLVRLSAGRIHSGIDETYYGIAIFNGTTLS